MGLSKASKNQYSSKSHTSSGQISRMLKSGDAHNSRLKDMLSPSKLPAFGKSIVLTVNPKLNDVASSETLNDKAAAAKLMFSTYRNKG